MGHNIQQKEKNWSQSNMIRKKLVTNLFYVANFRALKHNAKVPKVSRKFSTCAWSAICSLNVKRRVGNFLHNVKLVCPLLCCKFSSPETQCQSNEGFWKISYIRVICDLLFKRQKKMGWKFPTPCLSSSSLSKCLVGVNYWLEISTTTVFYFFSLSL